MEEREDQRLSAAVIPTAVLAGVVELGQRDGHAVSTWFAGTGVELTDVLTSGSVKVSFRQAATVLRRALRAMPDRPVGMQVGGRDVFLTLGVLAVAMRSCATVGEAVEVALELHQSTGSLLDVTMEDFGAEFALRLDERSPEPALVAFLCEEAMCSTLAFARSMLGAETSPSQVDFTYPEPGYVAAYRRFFRCRLRFEADANRMIIPSSFLDRTFATRHQPTRAFAIEACRRLLDLDDARPDLVVAVETLLSRDLTSPCTMAEAAAELHVAERTLRRQLMDAGERFSQIRDRVRERRATSLLMEPRLSVDAVGREVGFSDGREFRRAYVRWTGRTPSAARRGADNDETVVN